MNASLVLYEDSGWRALRPLTDLTPVPALAFGASNLTQRWRRTAGLPLLAIEARADAMDAWGEAPAPDAARAKPGGEVLAINAAALPGPWIETVRRAPTPSRFESGDRVVGARLSFAAVEAGLARGSEFEAFLAGLNLPVAKVEARILAYPWNLIEWNAEAIAEDLGPERGTVRGRVHRLAAVLEPARVTVEAGARVDPFAVLDARSGPIRIEADAIVLSHTVVVGPCVVGKGTHLLGGSIARSTIGPQCRLAGEVEECVWQGCSNKRHHGFVGHSAIGEWVNLGALTTTSDLKNNYGPVRSWAEGREVDTGLRKLGAVIGAHVKTGIGTLLPTGASIGPGSNLFGGGRFAPRHVPAFSWWDGERLEVHRFDAFLDTARAAVARRGRELGPADEAALRAHFESTSRERGDPSVVSRRAPP